MKKYLKQKLMIMLMMIGSYYIIQMIAFLWVGFSIFPTSFLVDFIFIIIISSVILVIPSMKWSIIYMSFWLFIVNALFVTNANTFNAYFELFTLEQFKLLGEATDILNFTYASIPAFLVFFILIGIYIILIKTLKKNQYFTNVPLVKKQYLTIVSIFLMLNITLIISFSALPFEPLNAFSEDQTLPTLKRDAMKRYGLLAYYYKEAELLYFTKEPKDEFVYQYLESKPSPYFGLLEGYNVFTIMIESGEEYLINEVLTPHLYHMMSNGLHLSNHYSENKTNVSEMIGMIGHYPPQSFDTNLYTYEFESSIPQILGDRYETAFFHDNYPVFYARGEILNMIGFDHLYFHDEIYDGAPRWSWNGSLTPDSETAEAMIKLMFKTDQPFYYFWTTLLTHGPYNEGEENIIKFTQNGYYDAIDQAEQDGLWVSPINGYLGADRDDLLAKMRYFQAAMMDTDRAIGMIIDALKDEGRYDETLFVIYGDHSAYYERFNHLVLDIEGNESAYYEMDLYTTFYTIYNQHLTDAYLTKNISSEIVKFTSPYTVVPTVLDLLGETYNRKFMLGDTIFNDLEHVFYSNKLTTFFTDRLYSDNGLDMVYEKGRVSDTYTEEFIYQSQMIIERLQWINQYYLTTRKPK